MPEGGLGRAGESEEDREVLILTPVSSGADPVSGSYKVPGSCGHLCWIAPSAVQWLAQHSGATTRCLDCLGEEGLREAAAQGMRLVPNAAAVQEVRQWFRRHPYG